MENSAFNARKKTKFELLTTIVTSLDVVLVLVATSLLTITFFRIVTADRDTENEIISVVELSELPEFINENIHEDLGLPEFQDKFPYSIDWP